jgi:GH24 family phage-related lysozyme (muramidase)
MSIIGNGAEQLIICQEVSGEAMYRRSYTRPTWPEGQSGATIGIGYDCGYSTAAGIQLDWGSRLPQAMVDVLKTFAGATGEHAHSLVRTAAAGTVIVSWNAAMDEFENVEIPRWVGKVRKVYPNTEELAPDCQGAIVSLSYNRGMDLEGERRLEMERIKEHLAAREFAKIPHEFRSMERLWSNGLVHRREVEAQLFEKGLAEMAAR